MLAYCGVVGQVVIGNRHASLLGISRPGICSRSVPRWILTTGHPQFTHENQPDHKKDAAAESGSLAPGSLTCPNATRAGRSGMIRFLARRLLNYVVLLALASFLTFCLTSVAFQPLDSLLQRNPRATAGRHRRQGPRARLGQTDTDPLRALGLARPSAATSARPSPVSPSSPELWRRVGVSLRLLVDRFAGGHRAGHRRRGVGRDPSVSARATASSPCWRCSS